MFPAADFADAGEPTAPPASAVPPRAVASPKPGGDPARRPSPEQRRVSSRGATARGVVVLIFGATLLAGVAGRVLAGHRTGLFGVTFAATSVAGAVIVRRRDLPVAMVAPPLLYCVLIAVMSLIDHSGTTGGFLTRTAVYLGTAFVTGAPAIWSGSLLAAGVGWYRLSARAS